MKENDSKILNIILRSLNEDCTITSIAEEIKLTRTGTWKILKKLEKEKLILLESLGKGKTSTYKAKINWENSFVEKKLSFILSQEANYNQRWTENFKPLEDQSSFIIIYGSILNSPKKANDIDILSATEKNNFQATENKINQIQKTQIKKIHFLNFTKLELRNELKNQNKAFLSAIKKGVVLFGQENFVKFIWELQE